MESIAEITRSAISAALKNLIGKVLIGGALYRCTEVADNNPTAEILAT